MSVPAWLQKLNAEQNPEAYQQQQPQSQPSYIQHTEPYSGTSYSPTHYATPETAQGVADAVGGSVIQGTSYSSGGPFTIPGGAHIDVNGDGYSDANAGLLAAKIAKNSNAPALLAQQLRDEFGGDYALPAGGAIEQAADNAVSTGYNSGRYSGATGINDVLDVDRGAEAQKVAADPSYGSGRSLGYEPNPNGTAWAEGVTPGSTPTSMPPGMSFNAQAGSIQSRDPFTYKTSPYKPMASGWRQEQFNFDPYGYKPFGG